MKSFARARSIIFVEDKHINDAQNSLTLRQENTGCFRSTGSLFNNALKVQEAGGRKRRCVFGNESWVYWEYLTCNHNWDLKWSSHQTSHHMIDLILRPSLPYLLNESPWLLSESGFPNSLFWSKNWPGRLRIAITQDYATVVKASQLPSAKIVFMGLWGWCESHNFKDALKSGFSEVVVTLDHH